MDRKPKARRVAPKEPGKPDDPQRSERFIEAARRLESDPTGERFEQSATALVLKRRPTRR
jgi:hypothetical protein